MLVLDSENFILCLICQHFLLVYLGLLLLDFEIELELFLLQCGSFFPELEDSLL